MQIDLTSFYNHSIRYNNLLENSDPNLKQSIYGVYGIVLTDEMDEIEISNSVKFKFNKNITNGFDNLICDGQTILLSATDIENIYIIGFCELGTVSEIIKIQDTECLHDYEFVLKTFHTNSVQGIDENEKNSKCKLIKKYVGSDGQKHNIFSWQIKLKQKTDISEIILPVNLSLHIMAIICL